MPLINVTSNTAKRQGQVEFIARMSRLETAARNEIRPIIKGQFNAAASAVRNSGASGISRAVDHGHEPMREAITRAYTRAQAVFAKEALTELSRMNKPEKKASTLEEFWTRLRKWNRTRAAEQVTRVNKTTKQTIAGIVERGMVDGASNSDIASEIIQVGEIASWTRATTIARTETHTAAVHAFGTAVESTGVPMDHGWVSTLDERTRAWHADANGQTKKLEEPFVITNSKGGKDKMMRPGDDSLGAGADQIVSCRCVESFTVRKGEVPKVPTTPPAIQIPAAPKPVSKPKLPQPSKPISKPTAFPSIDQEQLKEEVNLLEKSATDLLKKNPDLVDSLEMYKIDSDPVNQILRGAAEDLQNAPEDIKKQINDIRKLIKITPPIGKPITVYRGVSHLPEDISEIVGGFFDEKGFLSTSLDPEVAKKFGNTVFEISVPANKRAMFMESRLISGGKESEYLFPEGTRLRIGEIRKVVMEDGSVRRLIKATIQ